MEKKKKNQIFNILLKCLCGNSEEFRKVKCNKCKKNKKITLTIKDSLIGKRINSNYYLKDARYKYLIEKEISDTKAF